VEESSFNLFNLMGAIKSGHIFFKDHLRIAGIVVWGWVNLSLGSRNQSAAGKGKGTGTDAN
jgi:hypothetical protein